MARGNLFLVQGRGNASEASWPAGTAPELCQRVVRVGGPSICSYVQKFSPQQNSEVTVQKAQQAGPLANPPILVVSLPTVPPLVQRASASGPESPK